MNFHEIKRFFNNIHFVSNFLFNEITILSSDPETIHFPPVTEKLAKIQYFSFLCPVYVLRHFPWKKMVKSLIIVFSNWINLFFLLKNSALIFKIHFCSWKFADEFWMFNKFENKIISSEYYYMYFVLLIVSKMNP